MGFWKSEVSVLIVAFLIFLTYFVARLDYPLSYVYVIFIFVLYIYAIRNNKFINVFTESSLALILAVLIGYHSFMYKNPSYADLLQFTVGISNVSLFEGVYKYMLLLQAKILINYAFPALQYIGLVVEYLFIYLVLKLLKVSKAAILIIFTFIGFFGFPTSVGFAALAYYYLTTKKFFSSSLIFALSLLYGTRGLMAFGIMYLLTIIKRVSNFTKLIFIFIVIVVGIIILFPYVQNYLTIIQRFGTPQNISDIWGKLLDFIFRDRLQPWINFLFTAVGLSLLITIGFVSAFRKRRWEALVSIIILMAFFIYTFSVRINIFENPASDIPYYFLYAAAINSAIVGFSNSFATPIFLILVAGGTHPSGYVTFYEHTFDPQHYLAVVKYIQDFGKSTKFLYDYGSYRFRHYIPNGVMLQPWQRPDNFRGRYYIYSIYIYNTRMFYVLPHRQHEFIKSLQDVVYDTGLIRISPIR